MNRRFQTLFLALGLAGVSVGAPVPGILNHQGKVTVNGTNYTGVGQFKFALVNAGGQTTYWSNDGSSSNGNKPALAVSRSVTRGIFSGNLGDESLPNMTTIPAAAFTNSEVYLRTWFNDGANAWQQFSPDRRITSVAYALQAASADSAATVNGGLNNLLPSQAGNAGKVLTTDGANAAWGTVNASLPPGIVLPYAASTAPAGYLLCDGQAVGRTAYANLFALIGTTYGAGDGSTTFSLPDLRGRVPVMQDGSSEFASLNARGGEKTHTLTVNEMPSHNHSGAAAESPFSRPAKWIGGVPASTTGGGYTMLTGDSATGSTGNYHDHALSINSAGGGTPHNVLQPYIVLNYIIKY